MNTKKFIITGISIGLMGLLTACSGAAAPDRTNSVGAPAQPSAAEKANGSAPAPNATAAPQTQTQTGQERLIIRNATLTLVVKDTAASLSDITKIANDAGGYVNSSSTTKLAEGLRATVQLKIPSEKLDGALSLIKSGVIEVRDENITGQDVTADYVDLTSRLANLSAAEAQLRKIMDSTTNTADVLKVYEQLTNIRGQIEQVKGRMQFYERSAAMSTVSLTLIPDALAQPVQVAGWRPEGVIKQALETLIKALQALASIAIWLVIVALPVLVLMALPVVALVWVARRMRKNKKAAAK